MAAGMRQQKPVLVNLAVGFIVADICARYFDVFFSTMDRSLFFLLGGTCLMVIGAVAEKNRRRLLESFSQMEVA